MKKTFNRTMFIDNLPEAQVKVVIYDRDKYDRQSEAKERLYFTGLTSWDSISGGEEAKMIESDTDMIDNFHEYLILHFKDGTERLFCNSYVDLFIS